MGDGKESGQGRCEEIGKRGEERGNEEAELMAFYVIL